MMLEKTDCHKLVTSAYFKQIHNGCASLRGYLLCKLILYVALPHGRSKYELTALWTNMVDKFVVAALKFLHIHVLGNVLHKSENDYICSKLMLT